MTTLALVPEENAYDDLLAFAQGMARSEKSVEEDALRIIGDIVQDAAVANFDREGSASGSWPRLQDATVSERLRLGYGGDHPILVRTGTYEASFTGGTDWHQESRREGSEWVLSFGSDDYRATTHEFGRDGIPARPVLVFDDDVEVRIERGLLQVYDNLERRTRGSRA